jgi:hypothetical protein
VRLAGRLDGDRVAERAFLLLPDGGSDLAFREGSEFEAVEVGPVPVLRLRKGELFADLVPQKADFRIETPHALITTRGAGLNIRLDEAGTHVAVAHGAATVRGSPYFQELARDDSTTVAPDGRLGPPLRIVVVPIVGWALDFKASIGLLPNPGFEEDFRGWDPGRYDETQVRIDARAHSGRKSVLIRFNAVKEYEHAAPASSPFLLKAGARYRLQGYAHAGDLEPGPDGGVTLEVRGGGFRAGLPLPVGSTPWRKFRLDFDAPAETSEARLLCYRPPSGSPITGVLRLDELGLYEIPR